MTRTTSILPSLVSIGSLALALSAPVARAQDDLWELDGNPFCDAFGAQTQPVISPDGAGGALIAWEDFRTGDWRVFVTRVSGFGSPVGNWPWNGARVCSLLFSSELHPVVMADGAGGGYVAWSDTRDPTGPATYVTRRSHGSAVVNGWPDNGLPISDYSQSPRALLPHVSSGVLVIVSEYFPVTDVIDLHVHHVLAAGTVDPTWPVPGRSLLGTQPSVRFAEVIGDGSGGLFVAWGSGSNSGPDLRVRHFLSDGVADPAWPSSGLLLCSGVGERRPPSNAIDGSGGGYVAWSDRRGGNFDVYLQHFTAAGTVATGWNPNGLAVCGAIGDQGSPIIVPDGAGGVIAAWQDFRDPDGLGDVYASRISGDGTTPSGWITGGNLLSTAPLGQELKGLVSDFQGGAIACWVAQAGDSTSPNGDIYAQRVGPDGAPVTGWPPNGRAICTDPADQDLAVITTDGAHGAILAWRDFRNDYDGDIYAARVRSDGITPVAVSIARSFAAPGHAQVAWRLADPGGTVLVERAVEGGTWESRGTVLVDGSGEAVYDDREVAAGARYGYRIVVEGMGPLGEIWLWIPEANGFALRGLVPNPARGPLVASFALPASSTCRLELFDLSGRRLLARELGRLDPGDHRVHFGASRDLAPGVYLLVLSTGGSRASARVCVLD